MRSSRFFFLIASGLVLMLLILPVCCSEEKPEKPQKPEKAEKPIKSSGPAAIALPALKLQAFADLPPLAPQTVAPAMKDRATVVDIWRRPSWLRSYGSLSKLQSQGYRVPENFPGRSGRAYELIAAQMTVALVILENARWPDEMGEAEVIFGGVDPQAVQVELFAAGPEDHARQPMARGEALLDREGGYLFTAQVPATRPAGDFTPQFIPYFAGATVPLEIPLILWHH